MKFRTEIDIKGASVKLDPKHLILLTGSCFSDYIGGKIAATSWPVVSNPCGTLYNPASIALVYRLALSNPSLRRNIIANSITMRDEIYVSWFMGISAFGNSPDECIDAVCERVEKLEKALEKAVAIVVTFGTSDVWLLKDSDCAVGNCHKHPSAEFTKHRLTTEQICSEWKLLIDAIRERNPSVKFIFTVSPRRYLSEGFADNSLLKARLLLACEEICGTTEECFYFPAYEILIDDLRDYRFYADDLLHPSAMAVEYIWQKFCDTFLSKENALQLKSSVKNTHIPLTSANCRK